MEKRDYEMNILIIAPYFAPSSEVPSVRIISLSSYLVQKGHKVTVVCWSREKLLTMYDDKELSSQIPDGVNVVTFNSKSKYLPFIDDLKFGKEFKKDLPQLEKLSEYDILFVTCGPYFTLEALPQISKKFGIPYIVDFRDLGALNYRPKLRSEGRKDDANFIKRLGKMWYEKQVKMREYEAVINADGVICVSPIDKKRMQEAYKLDEDRCIVATNGFDDAKLSKIKAEKKQDGVVGAVFGKFMYYSKARAEALLCGINTLRSKGLNIRLMHIGRECDYIINSIIENRFDPNIYDGRGLKEYSAGMALLGSADFFLVEDTSPDDVGTKIYDYIFWNKPVIAAVPQDTPLAELVSTFQHGYVCDSAEKVYNALLDIVENKYDKLDSNLDIARYSRSYQNEKIESMMQSIASRR